MPCKVTLTGQWTAIVLFEDNMNHPMQDDHGLGLFHVAYACGCKPVGHLMKIILPCKLMLAAGQRLSLYLV